MGKPLILYGLAPLLNSSFEDGDTGGVPDNWTDVAPVNEDHAISTALFHSAGTGLPSIQSYRQNVDNDTVGNKTIIAQRVQIDDLITTVRDAGQEIAITVMLRASLVRVLNNVYVDMKQYDGSNLVIAEGTIKTAPASRTFITGLGPDWFMRVTAETLHADTNRIEVHIRYELSDSADYGSSAYAYWDRVFIGGLVDFTKGVVDLTVRGTTGYDANVGDGVAEMVRLHKPSTLLQMNVNNVILDSSLDSQLKSCMRMLSTDTPPEMALWIDRDRFTNSENHFQRWILDPRTPRISYPPGFSRRMYQLKGQAYTEFCD